MASPFIPARILRSHLPASVVVTDLPDHDPSGVGALSMGSLLSDSTGRLELWQSLMKIKPHGRFPTPQTGATRGMAKPDLATNLEVLCDLVLHSKYPEILPSDSLTSWTKP